MLSEHTCSLIFAPVFFMPIFLSACISSQRSSGRQSTRVVCSEKCDRNTRSVANEKGTFVSHKSLLFVIFPVICRGFILVKDPRLEQAGCRCRRVGHALHVSVRCHTDVGSCCASSSSLAVLGRARSRGVQIGCR